MGRAPRRRGRPSGQGVANPKAGPGITLAPVTAGPLSRPSRSALRLVAVQPCPQSGLRRVPVEQRCPKRRAPPGRLAPEVCHLDAPHRSPAGRRVFPRERLGTERRRARNRSSLEPRSELWRWASTDRGDSGKTRDLQPRSARCSRRQASRRDAVGRNHSVCQDGLRGLARPPAKVGWRKAELRSARVRGHRLVPISS